MPVSVEFIVISEESLPCCCLLGAGFLEEHGIVLDYRQHAIYFGSIQSEYRDRPVNELMIWPKRQPSNAGKLLGNVYLSSDDEQSTRTVRYVIEQETLQGLQNRDSAIRMLKTHVRKQRRPQEWKGRALQRFKRYWNRYRIDDELLVMEFGGRLVPVLPFRAFVEACCQTHCRLAYLGRPKLLKVMTQHFWHPALHKVTRDVCTTCVFCQLHKPSFQRFSPPTIKIQSSGPFDLVALDLLQFARSPRRQVALLVAVDHFSKFAMAISLLDKTSRSVCHALRTQLLPHILRRQLVS